jgi:hypothetical protein
MATTQGRRVRMAVLCAAGAVVLAAWVAPVWAAVGTHADRWHGLKEATQPAGGQGESTGNRPAARLPERTVRGLSAAPEGGPVPRGVPHCELPAPPEGLHIAENEPCGSDINGGCNSMPNAFTLLSANQVVDGACWASGGSRDTDWYQVTLSTRMRLTWRGAGQFPIRLFILQGGCPAVILTTAGGAACTEVSTAANLNPGTCYLFAGPDTIDGFPCDDPGGDWLYWAQYTLSTIPPMDWERCYAAPLVTVGTWPFDTTNAIEDIIWPCGVGPNFDVWFHYIAGSTGQAQVSTCDQTTLDTELLALDACGGALLACNDNHCGRQSQVTWDVTAGTSYWVAVGGYSGQRGVGTITISEFPDCPCDWDHSGTVNSQDFFAFINDFFAGNADYNGSGATNSQDYFDFLNCFFEPPDGC